MAPFLFIQSRTFTSDWDRLGLSDEELRQLEWTIMEDPKGAPVVAGTGGLRKLRFSSKAISSGKRGGLRICYVFFEESRIILRVAIYSKNEKEDLGPASKERIKELIESQRKILAPRQPRQGEGNGKQRRK